MAYLVIRISATRQGRDTVALHTRRAPIGEPRFAEIDALARRYGYEIRGRISGFRSAEERAEWPLLVFAYKSSNREGIGRQGGQLYSFPARRLKPAG